MARSPLDLAGRRAAAVALPFRLQVVGLAIGVLDQAGIGGTPPPSPPVADRADDAVAHEEHDEDEEAAHDQLPPVGQHAAEEEAGAAPQEGADEMPDDGPAAADR